jgi:hypothetical protein
LLDDRFALIDRGVADLDSGAVTAWPAGFRVGAATVVVVSRASLALEGTASVNASAPLSDDADAAPGKDGTGGKAGNDGKDGKGAKGAKGAKGKKALAKAPKAPPAKKGASELVIAVGTLRGAATLVVVDGSTVQTETIDVDATSASTATPTKKSAPSLPIGVVADRAGRITVAFANGAIAVREKAAWTTSMIDESLPSPKPGSPPAQSGPT